jgi:hypothetical protein
VAVDELSLEIELSSGTSSLEMMRGVVERALARLGAANGLGDEIPRAVVAAAERTCRQGTGTCRVRLSFKDRALAVAVSASGAAEWTMTRRLL